MKKITSIFFMSLLTAGLVFPQAQLKQSTKPSIQLKPSIKVTYPNGGETWKIGNSYNIQWTAKGVSGAVKISLALSGGANLFVAQVNASDGQFLYKVPGTITGIRTARVHVNQVGGLTGDSSDADFTVQGKIKIKPIVINSIRITIPTADGFTYYRNGRYAVMWQSTGNISKIGIQLVWKYKDEPPLVYTLASNADNNGRFDITITPNIPAINYYKLVVFDEDHPGTKDQCTVNIQVNEPL